MTGLYSWFLERGALPLVSRVTHSRFWELYREMLQLEGAGREELEDLQWQRLRDVLEHAHSRVPWYRDLWVRLGIEPHEISSRSDLARLPVLTKQEVRAAFPDRLTPEGADRSGWKYVSTRGTSDRLIAIHDFRKRDMVRAAAIRALSLSGRWRVGTPMVEIPPDVCNIVCGDEGETEAGVVAQLWELLLKRRPRDGAAVSDLRGQIERGWVLRKVTYPPFGPQGSTLPVERLDEYVGRLRADRPFLLKALPTYLFEIAQHVVERDQEPLEIPVVKPMGGTVSPEMRRLIEAGFSGQYREDYGSAEFGDMACDCERGDGLHVFTDLFLLEVVGEGRPVADGEPGKILVTDLCNRAMPLIRYQIGDVGRITHQECGCGRATPRLSVEGRLEDTLVNAKGEIYTPDRLMDFFYRRPGVREFQLKEERPGELQLLIVTADGGLPAEAELAADLRRFLDDDVAVELFRVKTIHPESGGKFRFIKSSSYQRLG